jgi:hypothetical protein
MNQPVRRKTDADATRTNQLEGDGDILWKTFILSSARPYYAPTIDRKPGKHRLFWLIHGQAIPGEWKSRAQLQREICRVASNAAVIIRENVRATASGLL